MAAGLLASEVREGVRHLSGRVRGVCRAAQKLDGHAALHSTTPPEMRAVIQEPILRCAASHPRGQLGPKLVSQLGPVRTHRMTHRNLGSLRLERGTNEETAPCSFGALLIWTRFSSPLPSIFKGLGSVACTFKDFQLAHVRPPPPAARGQGHTRDMCMYT